MRAIRFHYRPVRYLLARAASRRLPAIGVGRLGFVRLDDVAPPALPGPEWVRVDLVEGGPSLLYDSVGSAGTIRDSLSLTREGGRIVVTGAAGRMGVDLTRLWHRRLRMTGVMVYGQVRFRDRSVDIFDATLDLIRADDLGGLGLLTHTFELEEYRDAISVALSKRDHESIKIAFRPR